MTAWFALAAAAVSVGPLIGMAVQRTGAAAGSAAADGDLGRAGAVSPFADAEPAIARLEPRLRRALQQAAGDAEADGVTVVVTSGWRSARYQQRLLDEAVDRYGSREEAARWVSTPAQSEHVKGGAVDIGSTDADSWFQQHGSRYGLCQMYANEMWHFELAAAPGGSCPEQYESPATRYGAR